MPTLRFCLTYADNLLLLLANARIVPNVRETRAALGARRRLHPRIGLPAKISNNGLWGRRVTRILFFGKELLSAFATLLVFANRSQGRHFRWRPTPVLRLTTRSRTAGGLQDEVGDLLRMRDERQMARFHLDRSRAHAFGHEPLEIGIDRPILRRNRIEARLRTPGGVLGLAGQKPLVKRFLDRIERPRPGLGQVAREIVHERSLGQSSFVAVEDDARRGGRRGERLGPRRIVLSRIRGTRRAVAD